MRLWIALLLLLLALPHPSRAGNGTEDLSPLEQVEELGLRAFSDGDYERALPLFRRALELAEAQFGRNNPALAVELNNLAEIYRLLGRYDEAEPLYRRALELDERQLSTRPDATATTLNNLALLYRATNRYEEAEQLLTRALALFEKALGPDHPSVAKTLNNLAVLRIAEGRPELAIPALHRALEIAATAYPRDHPSRRIFERNLDLARSAVARSRQGRKAERRIASLRSPAPPPPKPGSAGPARAGVALASLSRIPLPRPRGKSRRVPDPTTIEPAAGGDFAVHLASVRSKAKVASEARRLKRRFAELRKLELRAPQSVEVKNKGTFYRVMFGRFPGREKAEDACRRLRAQGSYCEVVVPHR